MSNNIKSNMKMKSGSRSSTPTLKRKDKKGKKNIHFEEPDHEVHRGSPDFFAVMHDLAEMAVQDNNDDQSDSNFLKPESALSRTNRPQSSSALNKIPLRKHSSAPNSPLLQRKSRPKTAAAKSPLATRRSLNVDDRLNKIPLRSRSPLPKSPLLGRRDVSKPQKHSKSKTASNTSLHHRDTSQHKSEDYRTIFPTVIKTVTHEEIVNEKHKSGYQPDWTVEEKRTTKKRISF